MSSFARPALRLFLHKVLLVMVTAVLTGTAGAFFLWSLDAVTRMRFASPWLVGTLPVIGVAVAWLYRKAGPASSRGTGLILDEIQAPGAGIPARMVPLILIGTLATHLGGGSAGREGTAVQMGGGLAAAVGRWLGVSRDSHPGLLMAGVAAGFGAVFGTPWAGAVFAVEVLRQSAGRWREWPWCLAASWLADQVCQAWGGKHAVWAAVAPVALTDSALWGKLVIAAVAFGLLARVFLAGTQGFHSGMSRWIPSPLARPAVGGLLVIGLIFVSGTREYLGLGTLPEFPGAMVLGSFFNEASGAEPWDWAWKLVFTVVTVGSGFKGGEVTPLFFMGAGLGWALSGWLGLPVPLLAACGMVAVFGAAARTPAACFLMGVELFGPCPALPLALCCAVAAWGNPRSLYH